MNALKKILVMLPVLLLGTVFLRYQYFQRYDHMTGKKLLMLLLAVVIFYAWMMLSAIRRKQQTGFDMLLQSSFYVYVFSVLTLTGYFIFFNQVSAHNWWHRLVQRVDARNGVNLQPLLFMRGHHLLSYEVVGNFIMLMPLGFYLPMLFKYTKNFFSVTFAACMISVSIELMQLATNVRITDVDDVILNTAGASVGFIVYFIIASLVKVVYPAPQVQLSAVRR